MDRAQVLPALGATMENGRALDVPPSGLGLDTVMDALPVEARSLAGRVAMIADADGQMV
jgi:hypothetical protein